MGLTPTKYNALTKTCEFLYSMYKRVTKANTNLTIIFKFGEEKIFTENDLILNAVSIYLYK